MKILLSFFQDVETKPPHTIPAYRFWNYYIKNGIEEAQMKWVEVPDVDWVEGLILSGTSFTHWKATIWEKTLKYVKSNLNNIDIFLCYLYPQQIDENAIMDLQKLGIPCINFYCDNIRDFEVVPQEFKIFDLIWVPEFDALSMYKKVKVNHIHLPMPMWVDPAHRNLQFQEKPRISFIGSKDILREELLFKCIAEGLPIEVRGAGWFPDEGLSLTVSKGSMFTNNLKFIKQHGLRGFILKTFQRLNQRERRISKENLFEKPDFETYIQLTVESQITLGINRVPTFRRPHSNPLTYSRLRDIEAPMLGACYITEYTKDIEILYEAGNEIETYQSIEELVDKCNYLTRSASKRASLRINGQNRALSSHSIENSLKSIKHRLQH